MAREEANVSVNTDILIHHGSTDAPAIDIDETASGLGTIVNNLDYGQFGGYYELLPQDYVLSVKDSTGSPTVGFYEANLNQLGWQDSAITILASGFLDTSQNNNGPEFGLYAALAEGGQLIELPEKDQSARAQIIHNSADAALDTVDIWVNGSKAFDDLAFREATPFVDLPAATPLDIGIAGKNSSAVADTFVNFTQTLSVNETYVVVANGIVSSVNYNPAPAFDLNVKVMAREDANSGGNTDVLLNHGSTDAPSVDVIAGCNKAVNNLAYTQFEGYLELPTQDYVLTVTDSSGAPTVGSYQANFDQRDLQDSALTVLASGFVNTAQNNNGPGFGLYAALPEGGQLIQLPQTSSNARAQIIHNSADAAVDTVDIWINGNKQFDDLAFREATPFVDLPSCRQLNIGIADNNSSAVSDTLVNFTQTLKADEKYVVVANGIVNANDYNPAPDFGLDVRPMVREEANSGGNTDILLNHGATDLPAVDISATLLPVTDSLTYGSFDGYIETPTFDVELTVEDATSTATIGTYEANLSQLGLEDLAITVLASGFTEPFQNNNGPEFGLYVALPNGGRLIELPKVQDTANVQFIHNVADTAASTIDIWINNEKEVDNFSFREATSFFDLGYPEGTEVEIGIAGPNSSSPDDIIQTLNEPFDASFLGDPKFVAVLNGTINGNKDLSLDVRDDAREDADGGAGKTDLLAHHGTPDAPDVLIDLALNPFNGLAYTEFDGYLEVSTGNTTVTVKNDNDGSVIGKFQANLSDWNLEGEAITIVASGYLDPSNDANVDANFGLYVTVPGADTLKKLSRITSTGPVITQNSGFTLYPNPANDQLHIDWQNDTGEHLTLEMYNQLGEVVKKEDLTMNGSSQIDLSDQADGIYLIRLHQDGEVIGKEKVVKQ
jgi:hypothetical protein